LLVLHDTPLSIVSPIFVLYLASMTMSLLQSPDEVPLLPSNKREEHRLRQQRTPCPEGRTVPFCQPGQPGMCPHLCNCECVFFV
jgi:hypothetical protein